MKKHWHRLQPDPEAVKTLSRQLDCNPITAAVLVNRDIITLPDAQNFINSSLNNLRPPFSLQDMEAAVNRIYKAIVDHEKILVFGDYDVDGITAVVVLLNFLRYVGADVSYYIPHRITAGACGERRARRWGTLGHDGQDFHFQRQHPDRRGNNRGLGKVDCGRSPGHAPGYLFGYGWGRQLVGSWSPHRKSQYRQGSALRFSSARIEF